MPSRLAITAGIIQPLRPATTAIGTIATRLTPSIAVTTTSQLL
jgi:hypothetical protein